MFPAHASQRHAVTLRRGFTLIELLMVMAIIGTLAALIFPAIGMVRNMAQQSKSQNNLKQIALGMKIYSEQNDGNFPGLTARATAPSGSGFAETLAAFERLCAYTGGEMTGGLFRCPTADVASITIQPLAAATAWSGQSMSYAFDWSASAKKAVAGRVLLGDRDPEYWKGKGICVAYADTSTRFLLCQGNTTTGTMANNDTDAAAVTGDPINVEMNSDNVLCLETKDRTATAVDMSKIGMGSATSCALR